MELYSCCGGIYWAAVLLLTLTAAGCQLGSAEPAAKNTVDGLPVHASDISLKNYALNQEAAIRWKLPKGLREVSGLTLTEDRRLLAHDDEKGIVYEIDPADGAVVKSFELADLHQPVADDFEGIAAAAGLIYLVTSSGRLYEFSEGEDGQAVLFTMYTTGVGRECEIEGLVYEPQRRSLLLMSKNAFSPSLQGHLVLYCWSIDSKALVEAARTTMPIARFAQHIDGEQFQPTGIERHPATGNYFVVAAPQRAIAEFTPAGQVVAVAALPEQWHPQAEGITFGADYGLLVADEGGKKRARLTLYPLAEDH